MLGFYKNSISRIVVVWWATEMPDGENRLKSKKKSTTTENERVTGLRDYGVQSLIKAIIPPSNCLLLLLSSFFHLSSLDWQRERARQIRRQGFYFYSFFSFLTVIIIATKLLSYSYSFVSLFFFLFSFPLINGLV